MNIVTKNSGQLIGRIADAAQETPIKKVIINKIKKGVKMMKKFIIIGIALFNIYNNGLSMMNTMNNLYNDEQGVVNGSISSSQKDFVGS